jgi:hypothetical protein
MNIGYKKICEVKYSQINFIFFEFIKKMKKRPSLTLVLPD